MPPGRQVEHGRLPPRLPRGLELGEPIGEGRRSTVYEAQYQGRQLALKLYRPAFVEKYRRQYGVNIAAFEMARNRAFRSVPGLRPFAAEPVATFGVEDDFSPAFAQERIHGISLVALGQQQKGLPVSVLRAGEQIVALAEAAGLHDLDLYYKNILLRELKGEWRPVLHDFNLMPQHMFPPNPFLAAAYRLGLRRKSHRDHRCLRQWKRFSEQCEINSP
jgi:RIO-like serine/threonine protein kinase